MRVGNKDYRSTGIRWPDDDGAKSSKIGQLRVTRLQRQAYDQGMELLQAWARAYSDPTTTDEGLRPRQRIHLHAAIEAFEDEIGIEQVARHIRSRYKQAWAHYLTGGIDADGQSYADFPLTYNGLKERIRAKKATCTLHGENAKKVQYKLRTFTRWLVRQEILPKDPMEVIGIDKIEAEIGEDTVIDTPEEVQRQISWLEERSLPAMADFVRVTYWMGLRSGDALRMKATHYMKLPTGAIAMAIFSKKTKTNKKGIRFFPILRADGSELVPGLHPLMERLVANAGKGWLFPWRTSQALNRQLKECRIALGILYDATGKKVKTAQCWRASANVLWRDQLGWDMELRKLLLGHSARVNAVHYSTTQDAPDAMRGIERILGS